MLVNLVKYFIEIQVKLNVWLYRDFKGSFLFIFRVWSLFICLKIFSQQYLFQFLFLLWSNAHPTIIKYNLKLNVACGSSRTRNDNQAPNKHRRRWHAHHHILSKGFWRVFADSNYTSFLIKWCYFWLHVVAIRYYFYRICERKIEGL